MSRSNLVIRKGQLQSRLDLDTPPWKEAHSLVYGMKITLKGNFYVETYMDSAFLEDIDDALAWLKAKTGKDLPFNENKSKEEVKQMAKECRDLYNKKEINKAFMTMAVYSAIPCGLVIFILYLITH